MSSYQSRSNGDHGKRRREEDYERDRHRRRMGDSRRDEGRMRGDDASRVRSEVRGRDYALDRKYLNVESTAASDGLANASKADKSKSDDVSKINDAKVDKEPSPEIEYELQTEEEEARLIEERRRQRQSILLKHIDREGGGQSNPSTPEVSTPTAVERVEQGELSTRSASPNDDLENDAGDFELAKESDEASGVGMGQCNSVSGKEMSAADYDPSVDRALDDERAVKLMGEAPRKEEDDESEYEEKEVEEEDDVEDMFALADDSAPKKKKKIIRVKKGRADVSSDQVKDAAHAEVAGLNDNWDDADGYYRITLGERIGDNGRYQVFANLGRGMFSSVVKARDTMDGGKELAIKIVRTQETMYKAGVKEIAVLQKLAELDPDDKRHVIRLLGSFEHRKHLCMVFESLSMNLREVIKRFGKDVGLNLRAVRAYAHQMFLSLSLMRKAEIMHADIKPDNILVNETKTVLKMCDLGSASDLTEMEITPYLVSRFYRAPEIILGVPYDCSLDMWSIGCTLYELSSGKILFPGKTNNHMLLLMQELKGKFSSKTIRKGRFARMHFDESNHFMSREKDKNTGAEVMRKITTFTATDLKSRMLPTNASKTMSPADFRLTNSFIELLGKILELDPARRLTPNQALQHHFFSG